MMLSNQSNSLENKLNAANLKNVAFVFGLSSTLGVNKA